MFFKKLDYISPLITLNYKDSLRHKSIFAGFSTIIVILVIIGLGIYYISIFIKHENPSAFYFNRFTEDAGIFPINSSSMFTFVSLLRENNELEIDFDALTIIGINTTMDIYKDSNNLSDYNHWIYGHCNNDSDVEGIKELITHINFTKYACIRKFYRKDDKRYYDTNDPNFEWPVIRHGQSSKENATFYGLIVEECRNNTLRGNRNGTKCKSKKEIDDYLSDTYINLQVLDQNTDVLNYKNPIIRYVYKLSNTFYEEYFTINHMNFNPIIVLSHTGIFFDRIVKHNSFTFQQNEKAMENKNETGIYVAFYFWMQNRLEYYERYYKKLHDALADLGGISNLLLEIVMCVNYVLSDYIILLDTEEFVTKLCSKNSEKIKKEYKNLNKRLSTIDSNKKMTDLKEFGEQYKNNEIVKQANEKPKNSRTKTMKDNRIKKEENNIFRELNQQEKCKINNKYDNSKEIEEGSKYIFTTFNASPPKEKIETNINIIKRQKFTFCKYLLFLLSCYKNNPRMKFFYNLRSKIISEENIIENHLNIYNLMKIKKDLKPFMKKHLKKQKL